MIFEKVKAQIVELLQVKPELVTPESDFINDLNADSLDIAQMLLTMEGIFGIEFDEDEIKTLKTVDDVVKYIERTKK
ncbi:MAG: acyl carrier protein [Christensenellaceae bacterium]|nr:acyl carrier protein [Christensenellaceae bacterium]